MPDTTPKTKLNSRSFAIGIGVTEIMYILGLVALATGISLALGLPWALIITGLFLIRTAENNAKERDKGIK